MISNVIYKHVVSYAKFEFIDMHKFCRRNICFFRWHLYRILIFWYINFLIGCMDDKPDCLGFTIVIHTASSAKTVNWKLSRKQLHSLLLLNDICWNCREWMLCWNFSWSWNNPFHLPLFVWRGSDVIMLHFYIHKTNKIVSKSNTYLWMFIYTRIAFKLSAISNLKTINILLLTISTGINFFKWTLIK